MRVAVCLLLVFVALGACARGGGEREAAPPPAAAKSETPAAPQAVRYAADVFPIFVAKCVACHHANNAVKVILTDIFDPQLGMINRPNSWTRSARKILVVPGDPDASALVLKVETEALDHDLEGDPMPWAIPRLTERQLTGLAGWIDAGARNDGTFRTVVAPIFGDGVSLGSRGGKCAYCHHSGEGALRPDLTDVFNATTGAVGVASSYGGLRIAPGDARSSVLYLRCSEREIPDNLRPPMPMHYERLTSTEIATIREWIALGARND